MKTMILRICFFFLLAIPSAFAQQSPVFTTGGKAIQGYDPVAYFTDGKPVQGDPTLTATYDGATWQFASAKNRDTFIADPARYAPQYGGYCAYGTSEGHKAPTEADAFTIDNGKLYLNYNTKVRTMWNKDRADRIRKADANWPAIKDKDTQ
ncbi:YHS domain-containing (seleno)protein [Fibrella aquatilis]|uniref:YHS domain-containing protein n=1 Tax=Fibrella aquatilis TaxID=2817059 RepID=A0A939G905_9BACT|nr:YHS domain-containing (seleno)protein [Fibrella aquatilis]MBO0932342.1 YHS domain-containing protein [Fibrella aquatilis]